MALQNKIKKGIQGIKKNLKSIRGCDKTAQHQGFTMSLKYIDYYNILTMIVAELEQCSIARKSSK